MRARYTLAAAACTAALCGPLLAQPVAHWRFDEAGGTTAEDSAGSYDGTLVGPVVFVPGGVVGNAVEIPADGYVTMGDVLRFTDQSFSLSCWIRVDPGYPVYSLVVGKHTSTIVAGYFLALNSGAGYGTPNTAHFYTANRPGGEAIGTTTINDGEWHHLVGVYKAGANTRIYVDGAPVEGTGSADNLSSTDAPFAVAAIKLTNGSIINTFQGLVDDLQAYDYVLCDSDVEFLFQNPGAEHTPQCLADFNQDGSVNTLDVLSFLNAWAAGELRADVNCDLTVNTQDVLVFLNAWNAGC